MKWRRLKNLPDSGPLEGQEARKQAERALAEVRERRRHHAAMREWFREQYEENHFGADIDAIFLGRHK